MKSRSLKVLFSKVLVLSIIILSIYITACENKTSEVESQGNIVKAQMTAMEENLIKACGINKYFAFDVNVEELDVNWSEVWIDYYEKGKYMGKKLDMGSAIHGDEGKKGRIMLAIEEDSASLEAKRWIYSYITKNGVGSASSQIIKNYKPGAATWGPNNDIKIKEDETVVLGGLVEFDQETDNGHIVSVSGEFFENPEAVIDEMYKDAHVYVLRCKFSKRKDTDI